MSESASTNEIREFPRGCYVLLHIGQGPTRAQLANGEGLIVEGDQRRFYLRDDVWIEKLTESAAINIQKACEPAHHRVRAEVRDRHLYAFVVQVPEIQRIRYEGLEALHSAVALSRLVNPTSTGERYCAHVTQFGWDDSAVCAIEIRGTSLDVTLGPNCRDWLTRRDGEELRKLMPWTTPDKLMHPRVHRAYWNHEYALRSRYIDIRWTLVVQGLEALINTGTANNRHQFVVRIAKIAKHLGIATSRKQLTAAYNVRSKLVHTENFLYGLDGVLPRAEHDPLYETLELILRRAVLTALVDRTFGDSFESADTVDSRWRL